jgi:hypothetical protein
MFFGFAIGTLCLIGLFRAMTTMARRRHGFYGYGPYAYGFGHHHGFDGHHHHGFRRRGWHYDNLNGGCDNRGFDGGYDDRGRDNRGYDDGPPWRGERGTPWSRGRNVVFSILGRLEASPAQEKAILAALDEVKDAAKEQRGIGRDVRADVAKAIRGSMLDDIALEGATARIDDASVKLRGAVRAAIAKIHDVLDDKQRKTLADIVDSSWHGGW